MQSDGQFNSSVRIEFDVTVKKAKRHTPESEKRPSEPRIRLLLILAYQVHELLMSGEAKNALQIAGWLGITHGRLSQIMALRWLSPRIQEEILLREAREIKTTNERLIRILSTKLMLADQENYWFHLSR